MFKITDGRECFYQWDKDRQLYVEDNTITQVHFDNRTTLNSIVVEVKDGICDVPNFLLCNNAKIRVYGYINEGYTKIEEAFEVIPKSKPSDYIYTETEIYKIDIAVQEAIQNAKDSGMFQGESGKDGITPHIGENGNWFIGVKDTGINANGTKGIGISHIELNNNELNITLSDGTVYNLGNIKGDQGPSGKNGNDGLTPFIHTNGNWWIGDFDTGVKARGIDGISCEHKWDGTTLTITSASGTFSMDLKGEPGKDGVTPVKGDDYFTEEDKKELVNAVLVALPNGDEVSY